MDDVYLQQVFHQRSSGCRMVFCHGHIRSNVCLILVGDNWSGNYDLMDGDNKRFTYQLIWRKKTFPTNRGLRV